MKLSNKRKQSTLLTLVVGIVAIILINLLSSRFYTRLDLTAEKRYSLSDATKKVLDEIDDVVYFRVYLEGDFPAGFKRLRNATKEMLDEFRAYNSNIQYVFINPSAGETPEERNAMYRELYQSGIAPTDLHSSNSGENVQQIIFPGAMVTYKGKEGAVEFLNSQLGVPSELILNNSISDIEYNLINAINKLHFKLKPRVAFTKGHGELGELETADIFNSMAEFYEMSRVNFTGHINTFTERSNEDSTGAKIVNKYEAIVIAKPDSAFTEKEKFILDQYLMHGGKILWFLDPLSAEMDSLQENLQTVAVGRQLNLDDLLFGYGCRINNNLILDLKSLEIPIITGYVGDQPQQQYFPWYYFPILTPQVDHSIVKNMNSIRTEFISSIDTIKVNGIKKTPLLTTSQYSRVSNAPVLVDLALTREEVDQNKYNKGEQPVALLLEGEFKSFYRNRLSGGLYDSELIGFKENSSKTSMLVVADGDMIKNQIDYKQGYPLPLGYDKYTGIQFGNKDFIMNAMSYMLDEKGLIEVRAKDVRLRLLDKTKITEGRTLIQLINILGPVLLIIILAVVQFRIRKYKYSK